MLRLPSAAWILAPLGLAALYAAFYGLGRREPGLADLIPAEAVLTERFRDLEALNRCAFRDPDDDAPPAEAFAAARNLGGLPGVDRRGPFHRVWLPRRGRRDASLAIFPVAAPEAIRERFDDPHFFLDRGYVRKAQFLAIRGAYAAVSGDREILRHLGEGGISPEALGEDHALAVRVGPAAERILALPTERPWPRVLEALGMDPAAARAGGGTLEIPLGRVARVAGAWRTLRAWFWHGERRLRVDLEPAAGPLARRLAALAGTEAAGSLPSPPAPSEGWVLLPGRDETAVLALALHGLGVSLPEPLDDARTLERWARGEGEAAGPLLLWAEPSRADPAAWTLGLRAPRGGLPDLAPFHPAFAGGAGSVEVPAGALPVTRPAIGSGEPAPPGWVVHATEGEVGAVLLGSDAREVASRLPADVQSHVGRPPPPPPRPGLRLVAVFGLREERARRLFGPALGPGGVLAALGPGNLEGEVWTDGTRLVLLARGADR